jgi:hypothetical protein
MLKCHAGWRDASASLTAEQAGENGALQERRRELVLRAKNPHVHPRFGQRLHQTPPAFELAARFAGHGAGEVGGSYHGKKLKW